MLTDVRGDWVDRRVRWNSGNGDGFIEQWSEDCRERLGLRVDLGIAFEWLEVIESMISQVWMDSILYSKGVKKLIINNVIIHFII